MITEIMNSLPEIIERKPKTIEGWINIHSEDVVYYGTALYASKSQAFIFRHKGRNYLGDPKYIRHVYFDEEKKK